jgi:hypothetical protein
MASSKTFLALCHSRPGLRGQADMSHDRNSGGHDARHPLHRLAGALELHGVGAGVLDEAAGVAHGLLV